MNSHDDIIKCCRICRSDYNEDGEFVKLWSNELNELTATGQLYEELLGLVIDLNTISLYPQYLCNSCDLQMKLLKKLKMKAYTADEQHAIKFNQLVNANRTQSDNDQSNNEAEVLYKIETREHVYEEHYLEENGIRIVEELENDIPNNVDRFQELAQNETKATNNNDDNDAVVTSTQLDEHYLEDYCDINLDLTQDEDTTVDNARSHVNNGIHIARNLSATNDEDSTEYVDVFYLDDGLLQNSEQNHNKHIQMNSRNRMPRRQNNQSKPEPQSRQQFPCNECTKKFKTAESLEAHINVAHLCVPAYQCNLCPKTFKQKVHYRYHMDRHNNLRNFKCEICQKAFLSKTDLTVHKRFHVGERPYKCNICEKTYSLMQHLKMHMYSHNPCADFECNTCKQKFVSPTTLRTHMLTMHTTPRYKCDFCVKRFRRKHHLIAHYKVHDKQIDLDDPNDATTKSTFNDDSMDYESEEAAIAAADDLVVNDIVDNATANDIYNKYILAYNCTENDDNDFNDDNKEFIDNDNEFTHNHNEYTPNDNVNYNDNTSINIYI